VIGRIGHPLARDEAPTMTALAGYPWVVPGSAAPLRQQWEKMFADAGLPVPRVPIECGSVITIRQLLLGSDLLTVLSRDQVAMELRAGWLTMIGATPPDFIRHIGLVTRVDWRPTPTQRRFVALLQDIATA
jgi:DNA-binding transcriptional LysR family regulator